MFFQRAQAARYCADVGVAQKKKTNQTSHLYRRLRNIRVFGKIAIFQTPAIIQMDTYIRGMELRDYSFIIVGSGFSGAVIAERIASQLGQNVLVIEKRDHVGGNCYSETDPDDEY